MALAFLLNISRHTFWSWHACGERAFSRSKQRGSKEKQALHVFSTERRTPFCALNPCPLRMFFGRTCVRICHATITIFTDCRGMLWSRRRNDPRSVPTACPETMYKTAPTQRSADTTATTETTTMPPVWWEHLLQMNPNCAVYPSLQTEQSVRNGKIQTIAGSSQSWSRKDQQKHSDEIACQRLHARRKTMDHGAKCNSFKTWTWHLQMRAKGANYSTIWSKSGNDLLRPTPTTSHNIHHSHGPS